MADEIASLVVGIDSSSAVNARRHLDDLTEAGARTEQSAKKAGRAWIDSVERIAASTSAASAKFDTLNGTQSRMLATIERVANSLDAMSAAYARNGGQASATAQTAEKTAAAMDKLDKGARSAGAGLEEAAKKASTAEKAVGTMGSAFNAVAGYVKLAVASLVTFSVAGLVKESALLSARFETMGVVMNVAGNNAGYTRAEMAAFEAQMQKTGISMIGSREVLTNLATANIDLAQASKLARTAQDLAVVANINSTEALSRMVAGIKSGEVEVLKSLGLNVSFEASYQRLADSLGVSKESLTEQQKTQARANATMDDGARYVGIYEESLGTAGKAMSSMSRLWEDFKVKAGDTFLPTLSAAVANLTEALKLANAELATAGSDKTVDSIGSGLASAFNTVYETLVVLGANVVYVFTTIGKEIEGIGRQAAALAKLDFDGVKAIREEMLRDAEASRKAIDAFEARIMKGSPKPPAGTAPPGMTEAQRLAAGENARRQTEQEAARANWSKIVEQNMTRQQKLAEEITKIEAAGLAAGKTRAEIEAQIANARAKYAGPKGPSTPLDYTPQIQAIEQAAKAESEILARAARDNEDAYQVGLKGAAQYYETKGELATQAAMVTVNSAAAELEVVERLIASGKGSAAEQRKLAAERQKLTAQVSSAVLAAFEAEANGVRELERYWLGFQKGWTEAAESTATAAEDQADALRKQVDQYGMSKGAIADIVAARAREEESMARTRLAMAIMQGKRQEEIALIEREVAALGRRADALADTASSTYELDRLEANDKFTEEAKRQNEQIGDSLTDALLRGFEDGQGFAENFGKTLKNMFATLVLKPIIQPIAQGAANYVTGLLGLSSGPSSNAGSSSGGGSSVLGTANSLHSAYSLVSGGLTSSIASGIASIGNAIGSSAVSSFAAGMKGATLAAELAGPTTTGAAGAMGMGAAFAKAVPYIGWAVTAATVLSSVFGNKTKPGVGTYGLADITSTGSVAASNEALFFGDRRGYQGQSAGLTTGLATLGDQIAAAARLYGGDASGLRLYAQTAYSPDGKGASGGTALYGKDGQQVFGSAFEGTNEQMNANLQLSLQRALLAGLKESDLAPQFANVLDQAVDIGTATADELAAISAALESVRALHAAFDSMSITFPKLAELGWESREALVAAAGGLEAFTSNLGTYYQTYYTEAERMDDTLASMTATFKGLGLEVPGTKDEFRSLVESLDLTSEAGQKAYATLLGMNQTFAGWADYAKAQADKLADELKADADKIAETIKGIITAARSAAETQANGAMSSLTRAVNEQKNLLTRTWEVQREAMQKSIDTATTTVTNLQGLSDRLKSTLNTMFGQTDAAMQRAQAQAQIASALATARAGGGLPDAAALENALSAVSQPSQDLFATFEDYQRDFLRTANDIAALSQLTDSQLSTEEKALATLKDQLDIAQDEYDRQIDYYDAMLETAQAQLDAALGNSTALLTVSQALEGLRVSLASLIASNANLPKHTNEAPAGLSSGEQAVWDAYKGSGIGYLDEGGWNFWNEAIKNGADPVAIAAEIAAINKAKSALTGAYAEGGYAPAGLALVGERGPEVVDFRTPGRVYTNEQLSSVMGGGRSNGNAELIAEFRALRQEVQMLRAEAQATAQHTAKTAKLATRWDADGMPETREEATA